MVTLIIGTPDSGKSAVAEEIAVKQSAGINLYYLATMIAYDDVGEKRIAKHRKQREGKGFVTVEKPFAISELTLDANSTVLLECITNLVGNELYENTRRYTDGLHKSVLDINITEFASMVSGDIGRLAEGVKNLVIVTNRFDTDSETVQKNAYDDETVYYMKAVNLVNENIRKIADEVIVR